jgi:hypothetical protein
MVSSAHSIAIRAPSVQRRTRAATSARNDAAKPRSEARSDPAGEGSAHRLLEIIVVYTIFRIVLTYTLFRIFTIYAEKRIF